MLTQIYTQLPNILWQKIVPAQFAKPSLFLFNQTRWQQSFSHNIEFENNKLAMLSGQSAVLEDTSIALGYCAHQFGHFVPQLGDGRAHMLGQLTDANNVLYDIQLKGSGRTTYSRGGDGLCALKPALREYIVSHIMQSLGVPSCLSLSVVRYQGDVMRNSLEPGAIVSRIAKSHIRIGSFQYAAQFNDNNYHTLRQLADFTIEQLYPECKQTANPYLTLFEKVQSVLIDTLIHWLRVGFIHGVMNTDNILLSGETIDYGPCAWVGAYSKSKVFSSIDKNGRYAFGNQVNIMHWNLARLAEALIPIIDSNEQQAIDALTLVLNQFPSIFKSRYHTMMCNKLGLDEAHPNAAVLVSDFLNLLETNQLDYQQSFSQIKSAYESCNVNASFDAWLTSAENARSANAISNMKNVNPVANITNFDIERLLEEVSNDNTSILNEYFTQCLLHGSTETSQFGSPNAAFDNSYRTFCGT